MTANDYYLARRAEIGLLQNEDDVLQPFLLHKPEKVPSRLRPRIHHGKDEENEIGARDKTFRNPLMLGHHRVCAGRINDIEIAQKRDREMALDQLWRHLDSFFEIAVSKNADAIGRGKHIDFGKFFAEERDEE